MTDYWFDCMSEAFEENGIIATREQISNVAACAESAHENYSQAHGYDAIPNPLAGECDNLKRELARERNKIPCTTCGGSGRIITRGPYHSTERQCDKCHGKGRIAK